MRMTGRGGGDTGLDNDFAERGMANMGAFILGRKMFVSMLAAWGPSHLMLDAIGAVVLFRYRALVPLMFRSLSVEHLGRRVIYPVLPLPRDGAPAGVFINRASVAVMRVGLIFSLRRIGGSETPGAARPAFCR